MEKKRLYVDVHVLQTVPPSCVNRDDTGSPKSAIYGGVSRARVSSQSWKRAMRLMFRDIFPSSQLGFRTKRVVNVVANEVEALKISVDPLGTAQRLLTNAGLNIKSAEEGTGALFFVSKAQATALAMLAASHPETLQEKPSKEAKEKLQTALRMSPGIDVALFGRMVADDPSLNTDACAQVAHSISTHRVTNEFDYFTAVDDLAPEDNAGAGHIGTVEYNSATLYRYATVAVHELHNHLGSDTKGAVQNFVRAFAVSMPTGKQNAFANRTMPDVCLVTVRTDHPINLVGAFEQPILASEDGFVSASARRLANFANNLYGSFAHSPALSLVAGATLPDLVPPIPFDDLLAVLGENLNLLLAAGNAK